MQDHLLLSFCHNWIMYHQFSFGSNMGNVSIIRLDEIMLFADETISLTISIAL
jgi:uncharacterized protein YfaT (DUF1175 family)